MIGVGDKFPEFSLNGVSGLLDNSDNETDHDFVKVNSWDLSDWSVIYFYPKDFTFICPTEIVGMDNLIAETPEVFGISPDNEYCKWNWKCGAGEEGALYGVQHALLADCNNTLATELGIEVDEAELIKTNSTGLTIYNPSNLANLIKGMKNKTQTREQKILARKQYEQSQLN